MKLSFAPSPATAVGRLGMLRLVASPCSVNMDVEMMMAELKGRLCSSRSLCAITAVSGHLLCCLPGDCRCPWQQLLSQSTSAGWWSLKLPVSQAGGALEWEGHGEQHCACSRAGGLARAVPVCHLPPPCPCPTGIAVCWAPPHLGAGRQMNAADRSLSCSIPGL